jgi:hypothetical protein
MKSFKNMASMVREEVSAPPMAARSLYTKMYAKHGGTASKAKEAQSKAYAEVEKKHGKQMRDSLEAYHKMNEETDTSEKIEMTQAQLHFIHYACEEILEFIDDGGEVEEWYQVKVAKAFSEFESLHSYMEGEARRTGMKEEVEQIDELSKKTLGGYIKSATHDVAAKGAATRQFAIDASRKSGEQDYDGARKSMAKSDKTFSKSWKRRDNMAKAVDRLTKEEIEQIDEKNVPTSPEKWAQAKSQAKAKFDVYPSAYANGWAAKKYKEMGGGWKSVNEEKNDAPFEGGKPVSSKKSVVPGKYGVGFSTAKHLAKTAMKKQSDKMKKPVKEEASPKVKIVKDIMKKKKQESADTFQKDPIISKSEVRM